MDRIPFDATFVNPETDFKVFQGRTLHVQFQMHQAIKSAIVHALSKTHVCFPESKNSTIYEAFIPIPRKKSSGKYLLSIELQDHTGNNITLEKTFDVVRFPFKRRTLRVSGNKLQKETGKNSEEFKKDVEKIYTISPKEKLWNGNFCAPINIVKKTADFGTLRITKERGKYIHNGVDITNEPKCPVWAAQNGIICVKNRYLQTGNTVIIDHGFNIISMYFHLEDLANISVGDTIKKGNLVGTMGQTGYATGYHLHWEIRINNIPVDPMQWTQETF